MTHEAPILVTGAAGRTGAVGRMIVEQLRTRGVAVRATVRREDPRAEALRSLGAEVVVGDLSRVEDVVRMMAGCRRIYFGLGISPPYLEATVASAAAALAQGGIEVFLNISQMTVSQMSLTDGTDSPQHRQHWLAEQALNWSGLPVVHVRPTVFLDGFFLQLASRTVSKYNELRLPFGTGRTSPIAAFDVARTMVEILVNPSPHIGKVYELTGERSQDLTSMAIEYSRALNRSITYRDVPHDVWERDIRALGIGGHLADHLATMARLHADNRYDRMTEDVLKITGSPPMSVQDFVARNARMFDGTAPNA